MKWVGGLLLRTNASDLDEFVVSDADADLLAVLQTAAPVRVGVDAPEVVVLVEDVYKRQDHTLTTTIVDGRGFTAVMVSWMSKFNPFIMIAASLLLVVMDRGASEVSSVFSLNHSFADILTGIILFFIIGTEFFITYKVSLRKNSKKEA